MGEKGSLAAPLETKKLHITMMATRPISSFFNIDRRAVTDSSVGSVLVGSKEHRKLR